MHHFKHRFTLPAILILLVLALSGFAYAFFNLKTNTTVPRGSNMSVLGIELDQNTDGVDLHQLEKQGISFVYLRATQGKTYFDDNYLTYRDRILGTKLSFGSIITFSDESSAQEQFNYFEQQVGRKTGNLPIMIVPAKKTNSVKYWKNMALLSQKLNLLGKKVLIAGDYTKKKYFPVGTDFLYTGASLHNKNEYSFWCYTQAGRVKNVTNLNDNVTMFAYIGNMADYQAKYATNFIQ